MAALLFVCWQGYDQGSMSITPVVGSDASALLRVSRRRVKKLTHQGVMMSTDISLGDRRWLRTDDEFVEIVALCFTCQRQLSCHAALTSWRDGEGYTRCLPLISKFLDESTVSTEKEGQRADKNICSMYIYEQNKNYVVCKKYTSTLYKSLIPLTPSALIATSQERRNVWTWKCK